MGTSEPGHRATLLRFRGKPVLPLIGCLGYVILLPVSSTAQTARPQFGSVEKESTCCQTERFEVSAVRAIDTAEWQYLAHNPSQGFSVWFSHLGIDISQNGTRHRPIHLRLSLDSWGSENGLQTALPAVPWAEGRDVEYYRGSISEQYRNGPQGLEQLLKIDSFPPGGGRFLTLQMAVDGDLKPRLDQERRVVGFDGPRVLNYTIVDAIDGDGRASPCWFELTETGTGAQLRLIVDTQKAIPPFTVKATVRHLVKLQPNPQDEAGAEFGSSVAVNGNVAVVGQPHYVWPELNRHRGSAFVYYRDKHGRDMWGKVAELRPLYTPIGGRFGASVAISGDIAIIGASGSDTGAAHIFMRDHGGADNWGHVTTVEEDFYGAWSGYGSSIAISGNTAIVGARGKDSAFIYKRPRGGPNQWGEIARIHGRYRERFGSSVSISGDTAAVGAPSATVIADGKYIYDAGRVHIFERNNGGSDGWGEVAQFVSSDPENEGYFGGSVALDRNTLIVGEWGSDYSPGAVHVFSRTTSGSKEWRQTGKLTATEPSNIDTFGHSVSLSGQTILVGAPLRGSAYIFRRNVGGAGGWIESAKLTSTGSNGEDLFGRSLSINLDTVIVGAPWDQDRGEKAGSAYLFRLVSDFRRAGDRRVPRRRRPPPRPIVIEVGEQAHPNGR